MANAAPGAPSSTVTIEPVRVLDSRDPIDVGLAGPFSSGVSLDLQITGSIPTTDGTAIVVPEGATGVLLNVTAVAPTADGFVSLRPADATGPITTSNLNALAGDIVPNAVTVQVPTTGADAGKIEVTFNANGQSGPTADILIDVVGFLQEGAAGPQGETGAAGADGADGAAGTDGAAGADGPPGIAGISTLTQPQVLVNGTFGPIGTPPCPTGEIAISGGYNGNAAGDLGADALIQYTWPANSQSWAFWFRNSSGANLNGTSYTICAQVAS